MTSQQDSQEKNELKKKSKLIKPLIRVGKKGITEESIAETRKLLKRKKLVKIRFLRNFMEKHEIRKAIGLLCEKTGAELIDNVGFTAVIYKR